jgi:hypothetical protein
MSILHGLTCHCVVSPTRHELQINRHIVIFYIYVVAVHTCCCPHCCRRPLPPLPSCPPPPSILITPDPICLAVLGIYDSNDNHISSLNILSRKSLAHLQNSRPYPFADAKGGRGCKNHCNCSDSVLATATPMTMMMIVVDVEMMLVHSCGGGMIRWVHSPSLPGCHCCRPPAPASQQRGQGGRRHNNNRLGHRHLSADCCRPLLLAAASMGVNAIACHYDFKLIVA